MPKDDDPGTIETGEQTTIVPWSIDDEGTTGSDDPGTIGTGIQDRIDEPVRDTEKR